jgi:hypothetical protein
MGVLSGRSLKLTSHLHQMTKVIDVTHGNNFNYCNQFYPNIYISFFHAEAFRKVARHILILFVSKGQ